MRERYLTNFGLQSFTERLLNKHAHLTEKVQKMTGCSFADATRVATYNYVFRGLTDAQLELHLDTSNITIDNAFEMVADNVRLSLVRSDRMTYIQDRIFRPRHYGFYSSRLTSEQVCQHLTVGEPHNKYGEYHYCVVTKYLPRREEVFKYLVPRHFRKCLNANMETSLVREFLKILHDEVVPLYKKYVSLRIKERVQHYKEYKANGEILRKYKMLHKYSKTINYEEKNK